MGITKQIPTSLNNMNLKLTASLISALFGSSLAGSHGRFISRGSNGFCLGAVADGEYGDYLAVTRCHNDNLRQSWMYDWDAQTMTNRHNGQCMGAVDGNYAELQECNGGDAQRWNLDWMPGVEGGLRIRRLESVAFGKRLAFGQGEHYMASVDNGNWDQHWAWRHEPQLAL